MATLKTNINQASADFQAIKNKIVESGVEIADGTPTREYANKIGDIYKAGKKSEYDRFWDAYQENGNRTDYSNAFSGFGWTRETFKPKYDIPAYSNLYMLFYKSGMEGDLDEILKEVGITINTLAGSNNFAFSNTKFTDLGEVDLSVTRNNGGQMFAYNQYLKTIRKLIFANKTILATNAFTETSALENLTIEGTIACDIDLHWSTKLTEASIRSIIEHLSWEVSLPDHRTVTLSKKAVDDAFRGDLVYDAELGNTVWDETIDGSLTQAWANLVASAPLWTITLI